MPKGAYIGVDNIAHKIKKGYIGVDGVARRIRKAYIGVGGVARPCWNGGELTYYGTPFKLSYGRRNMGADSNGMYAIFGSGSASDEYGYLDAFNASLELVTRRDSASALAVATHVGDYVVFFKDDYVEAYDLSLTQFTRTLPVFIREGVVSYNKNYALYGSGSVYSYMSFSPSDMVCACDASLSCIEAPQMIGNKNNMNRDYTTGGGVGEYAVFANASGPSPFTCVYDGSLEVKSATSLNELYRKNVVSVSVGNYVLFTGGIISSTLNTVEAYNSSLTLYDEIEPLSQAKYKHTATTLGDLAIIGSGMTSVGNSAITDTVDSYDSDLTKRVAHPLSEVMRVRTAASIGNYAIFTGGGYDYETTDVYTIV